MIARKSCSRRTFLRAASGALAGCLWSSCRPVFRSQRKLPWKLVETDAESGARIFQLTDDERPTDDIYGEQPYSSPSGDRIAVQHTRIAGRDGGISIVDLHDGAVYPVVTSKPGFPAFHAWGEYLYYQEEVGEKLLLRRCHYRTLDYHFKHEQFSRCGRYWLGDATGEKGVPIHIGSLKTGRHRRLVFSRTVHTREQSSHRHPYLTADNRWLIFNSTRSGRAQVYGARVPEQFLLSL